MIEKFVLTISQANLEADAFKLVVGHYPIASWFTETYAAVLVAAISMVIASLVSRKEKNMAG